MRAADRLGERFNAAWWFVGRHVAEGRGDHAAIVSDDGDLSYAKLDDDVRRFATVLRNEGVHRGERVALILPDTRAWAVAFWGTLAAGAVAVPLNTLLKPEEYRAILGDCDARIAIVDPAIVDRAALEVDGCAAWDGAHLLGRVALAKPRDGYAQTHRDAFAFFLYSSGTTGEPKGVVHLHHDAWVCARTYGEKILRVRPSDRAFSVAKLFFAYGLGNAQYFPMDVGAACILYAGRPAPQSIFEQVERHRPTLFFGVPTGYAQMLAAMDAGAKPDFSSVRACVSAGEALPAPIFERWRDRTGLEILDGIGSTEICHIFLSNTPGACRPGSSGHPVPGYRVRIVDDDGRDIGGEGVGDLLVEGDSTMALYWNKHERTKAVLEGSWIRTGDKYHRDADGYYWHSGRSDDMLKVGGIWVSPVEVEAALTAHDAVLECAVVGREDDDGLVKPHAFVVVKDGAAKPTEGELQAFVKARLAPYKYPRWVTFLDALPKTATGKIRRFQLRAQFQPGQPAGRHLGHLPT
ncbi:MAG TPA: benzoate-CoA ligase family protein [Candidatus Dormibacteraeota bacterium]|nr:benzoate-CoA ligase family protein [Candidatus Dormibacteraeota bacterium]